MSGISAVETAIETGETVVAAALGAAGPIATDVAEVVTGGAITTRIAGAEDLLAQIVAFLTHLFPGHPNLPVAPSATPPA